MLIQIRGKSLHLVVGFLICLLVLVPISPLLAEELPTPDQAAEQPAIEQPVEDSAQLDQKDLDLDQNDEPQAPAALGSTSTDSMGKPLDNVEAQKLPGIDQNNGSVNYEYPIVVPPGRNNMQPDLRLVYNSELKDGVLGVGWVFSIPKIERINLDGLNLMYSENHFNSSLSGELIQYSTNNYISKFENGEFLTNIFTNNSWTVVDKKGTIYTFGSSASSQIVDPNDSTKTFAWWLEEIRDPNNNFIKYEYYKDANQIYPSRIVYTGNGTTNGIFEITFQRESRNDTPTSYASGFSVKTSYRINTINVINNGSTVGSYALTYTPGDNNVRSVLSSITRTGTTELGGSVTLPAVSFTHQKNANLDVSATNLNLPSDQRPEFNEFADINGDGYSDLFLSFSSSSGSANKVYFNNTNGGWTVQSNYTPPKTYNSDWTGLRYTYHKLVDVNGDGLTDLVSGDVQDCSPCQLVFTTYINSGSGWVANSTWQVPFTVMNSSGVSNDAQILDVNGDGLPDMVRSNSNNVYLNNGSGWNSTPVTWNWPTGIESEMRQRLTDLNGDGIIDVMLSWTHEFRVRDDFGNVSDHYDLIRNAWLGNGLGGFTLSAEYAPPISFEFESSVGIITSPDLGVRFYDYNSDGLVDIVQLTEATYIGRVNDSQSQPYENPTLHRIYLNTGKGWSTALNMENCNPTPCPKFSWGGQSLSGYYGIAEFNGNKLTDIYNTNTLTPNYYQIQITSAPIDGLKTVTYPTGGNSAITYKLSTEYRDQNQALVNKIPQALFVLSTLTTNDGLGNQMVQNYSYEGGKYYFNTAFDRRFAGFNKITKSDAASKTTIFFHQGDSSDSTHGEYNDSGWKIGKPYRIEIADTNGNLYSKTINKWDEHDQSFGNRFIKLVQSLNMTYDGDSTHKDKAETYAYNNTNGNLTQKLEYGQVTGSDDGTFTDSGSDDFTTTIDYATNGTYIVGLPKIQTVTDHNTFKVKESKLYYDTQSYGLVIKGNLTKKEDWKSGSIYINTQKTYDTTYGVVTSETDPRGKTTSYTYDSFNLYPATVTNPLNHTTSFAYDYSSGEISQKTDPNTRVFQWTYDGLDRVTAEKQPDLATPSTLVTKTAYTYTDTANAVSVHRTDNLDSSIARETYQYFDGLGRLIQTRVEADGTNYQVTDKVYNTRGLLDKESLPYFSTGTSKTSATSDAFLYLTYTYDPMQRVLTTTNSVGTTSNAYNDWKLTITDPRAKLKDLYKDAFGNLIQVDEHNGVSAYTTTYNYSYLGNLTKVTDALSNIRNFTYDGLGRRLTAQDLHAPADAYFGTWTYTFDDAGNLTQVVDPKNQTINYTYDDLNRQLTENYTGLSGTEVTYIYDSGTDGKGHLTGISTATLTQSNTYNPLGGIKTEAKTLNSTTYTTTYDYDRGGNQTLIINPDNSQVKYNYNEAGLLESVQRKEATDSGYLNVITNFDYSPMQQPTTTSFANGVTTTNTYDAGKLYRLSTKVTVLPGSVNGQHLTYTYDPNGNITTIVDVSATNTAKTADYVYDDLNRLTSATITNVASGQSNYAHTFSYDAIGNLTNKSDVGNYSYAGNTGTSYANPHAATTTGPVNMTYDNNGNALGLSAQQYTWDYNNRLTQAVIGSTTVTYDYDPTGQRIRYTSGSNTTYYPSKYFNIKGTLQTKHIFANGIEVAVVRGTGTVMSVESIHTDHLTGANMVTNSTGGGNQVLDYYPFGAIRLNSQVNNFNEQRKFAGSEFDDSTGMNYMNARYYQPDIARFLSQDPAFIDLSRLDVQLIDPQSWNSYAYGRNNPLRFNDPDGNTANDVVKGGLNALGAGIENFARGLVNIIFDPNKTVKSIPQIPGNIVHDLKESGRMIVHGNDEEKGYGIVNGAIILWQLFAPETKGGNVSKFERLSDDALVCRGGTCSVENFIGKNARNVNRETGLLDKASVNSAAGKNLEELARGLPNNKIGFTTVGEIRKAGGDVIAFPTLKNINHAILKGISPEQASSLFKVIPNPAKK